MSGLYGFASRLSGCMAGLCAILSLLALPSPSQADTLSDCQACCQNLGLTGYQYEHCMDGCMIGQGPCAANPPNCGTGNPDCDTYKVPGDCEPGFNNKCFESNVACACRWRLLHTYPPVNKCVCQLK